MIATTAVPVVEETAVGRYRLLVAGLTVVAELARQAGSPDAPVLERLELAAVHRLAELLKDEA